MGLELTGALSLFALKSGVHAIWNDTRIPQVPRDWVGTLMSWMMAIAATVLAVRSGLDVAVDQHLLSESLAAPGQPSSGFTVRLSIIAASFGVLYRTIILVKINICLVAIARILRKDKPTSARTWHFLLGYRICLLIVLVELHAILQLALSVAVTTDLPHPEKYQVVRHWSTLAVQLCAAIIMALHSSSTSIRESFGRLKSFFLRIRDVSAPRRMTVLEEPQTPDIQWL